ncbi:neuronal acetylcholine receptor subunit alpha-3-like [Ptychodera flava]|uniref:neuronal acetylcholine receptor subunit alpha-3-like n=1 Tax=Ptychodera flava TaxID=63121 RepID=UPI003969F4CD
MGLLNLAVLSLVCLMVNLVVRVSAGAEPEERLFGELFKNYNRLIRPVRNVTDLLTVELSLTMSQLIDVNEKDQIMTANVWLKQQWYDYRLSWDPIKYENLSILRVPSQMLWLPDIVLFNNADGNYEVTLMTKALLYPNGLVYWLPPAIYKSSCNIDVQYFPFDEQKCIMKYGSWTYDGYLVDVVLSESQVALEDYWESGEWDIIDTPGEKNTVKYSCCDTINVDVTFTIHIRRKPLFYTVNLIIPCVLISFLTVLVFYLPSDCGEKITLCISVLLALTVFLLLVSDIIPPTSLVIPLIGRYLLFTMVLVTVSIVITVIVLNIHHRAPSTHTMPKWVRRVFLETLPPLLMMKRHQASKDYYDDFPQPELANGGIELTNLLRQRSGAHCDGGSYCEVRQKLYSITDELGKSDQTWPNSKHKQHKPIDPKIKDAVKGVSYIAQHLKNEDDFQTIREDWKYVAMVIDRIFLWIFLIVVISGTGGILLSAPTIYKDRKVLA